MRSNYCGAFRIAVSHPWCVFLHRSLLALRTQKNYTAALYVPLLLPSSFAGRYSASLELCRSILARSIRVKRQSLGKTARQSIDIDSKDASLPVGVSRCVGCFLLIGDNQTYSYIFLIVYSHLFTSKHIQSGIPVMGPKRRPICFIITFCFRYDIQIRASCIYGRPSSLKNEQLF